MSQPRAILLLIALVAAASGCGPEQRGAPRLKTYPVTGTVLVDGEPAAGLTVECHPQPGAPLQHEVATSTDENGKFAIGTYESKDGLPEGSYALAFVWTELGINGKDKLRGAYSNPKNSEHKVTVVSGQPNDLGEVKLSTK